MGAYTPDDDRLTGMTTRSTAVLTVSPNACEWRMQSSNRGSLTSSLTSAGNLPVRLPKDAAHRRIECAVGGSLQYARMHVQEIMFCIELDSDTGE